MIGIARKPVFSLSLVAAIVMLFSSTFSAQEGAANPQAKNADSSKPSGASVDKALLDKLQRYLTGSKWTGNFTITGKEDFKLTPETYEITKARKAPEGDYWLLTARIKYGGHDKVFDLPPLEIKWAGKSPVITVDQLTIPGLGTFDARVIIRKNKYAGTWSHNDVGGHLFGVIEKDTPNENAESNKTPPASDGK